MTKTRNETFFYSEIPKIYFYIENIASWFIIKGIESDKEKTVINIRFDFFGLIEYQYLPTPPLRPDMTQGQFLSGV